MPRNLPARLPLAEHLDPVTSSRTVFIIVKQYYYPLYNATNDNFRKWLTSVGNKDSLTENRVLDRGKAVDMIRKAAADARDASLQEATDGKILQCITRLMKNHGQGLRVRRQEYRRLTQQAAE